MTDHSIHNESCCVECRVQCYPWRPCNCCRLIVEEPLEQELNETQKKVSALAIRVRDLGYERDALKVKAEKAEAEVERLREDPELRWFCSGCGLIKQYPKHAEELHREIESWHRHDVDVHSCPRSGLMFLAAKNGGGRESGDVGPGGSPAGNTGLSRAKVTSGSHSASSEGVAAAEPAADTSEEASPTRVASPPPATVYPTCWHCRTSGPLFEKYGEMHSTTCVAARLRAAAEPAAQSLSAGKASPKTEAK